MKPIERVEIIIKDNNLNPSQLEKIINAGNGTIQTAIKRKANLKDKTLIQILSHFSNYRCEWLLLGEGEMLKKDSYYVNNPGEVNEHPENYSLSTKLLHDTIASLKKDKEFLYKQIDFLNEELSSCLENKKTNVQAS